MVQRSSSYYNMKEMERQKKKVLTRYTQDNDLLLDVSNSDLLAISVTDGAVSGILISIESKKSYDHTYILYTEENQNMVTKTRSNITDNDLGKCICVSFPLHETALIEDLDHLANQEYVSRSQYIRRLIRREKQTNNNIN